VRNTNGDDDKVKEKARGKNKSKIMKINFEREVRQQKEGSGDERNKPSSMMRHKKDNN
jgi:hypothetical protein